MKKEEPLDFPVIRLNDFAKRISSRNYAWLLVHRLVKAGKLKRVVKGVYTNTDDIFAIASNIYYPSYISFLSSSYLYGFTETIPRKVSVVTAKHHKPIEFEGYLIDFIRFDHVWGYHKEGSGKHTYFIADIEKLMIDGFLHPVSMGNFKEIENVFKMSEKVDEKKILDYLNRINSRMISRKVGYMLEKYKGIDISEFIKIDKNYYQLDPFKKSKTINKKWRLFV